MPAKENWDDTELATKGEVLTAQYKTVYFSYTAYTVVSQFSFVDVHHALSTKSI